MSDEQEFPPQQIDRPGSEGEMDPEPQDEMRHYEGTGKLEGKVALVTGGDSGIGRAVCAAFAKEGAAWLADETHERYWIRNPHAPHKGYIPLEHWTPDYEPGGEL